MTTLPNVLGRVDFFLSVGMLRRVIFLLSALWEFRCGIYDLFLCWSYRREIQACDHQDQYRFRRDVHHQGVRTEKKDDSSQHIGESCHFWFSMNSSSTPNSNKIHRKLFFCSTITPRVFSILFHNSSNVLQKHFTVLNTLSILPGVLVKLFQNSEPIHP